MKIKNLLVIILLVSIVQVSFAGDKNDKPYFKEVEKMRMKKSGIFNLNLDIQIGMNFSKTTFELNRVDSNTSQLQNPKMKIGPSIGAILSVDFLGFGFTTGAQYTSKGYKVDSTNENRNLNYFNIPLLLYFDATVGKVIIDGNIGPYFGLLISQDDNTGYKVKNFDLGLTGNIQGAYMFQKLLGVLLGFKYDYGGLNNLGNNEAISKIKTQTFYVYSGIKFLL